MYRKCNIYCDKNAFNLMYSKCVGYDVLILFASVSKDNADGVYETFKNRLKYKHYIILESRNRSVIFNDKVNHQLSESFRAYRTSLDSSAWSFE